MDQPSLTVHSNTARPFALRGRSLGRLLIVLAAVLWSTNGLFVKSHVFDDWPADSRGTLLAFWRAFFAGMLLLPAVRRPRWTAGLAPMALCFAAMNVCFLQSMTRTTAANAVWLQSTAPLWVFLLSLVRAHDRRDPRDATPLLFAMAGVGMILTCELARHSLDSRIGSGVLLGLASGVCYAGVVVSMRSLRAEGGAFLVAVNHLGAAVLLAPFCLWLGQGATAYQLGVLAAFGFFQMGVPYLLFARGLREVPSQEAAAITLLEPVLVPIWVYLTPGGERPAWWTIVGGGLILTGLVLRYWRAGRTPAGAP